MSQIDVLNIRVGGVERFEGDVSAVWCPGQHFLDTWSRRQRPSARAVGPDEGEVYVTDVVSEVERDMTAVWGPVREARRLVAEATLMLPVGVGDPQAGGAQCGGESAEADLPIGSTLV